MIDSCTNKKSQEAKEKGGKKRIFLIAPTHMELYKDIVEDLENKGFSVEFLAMKVFPHDPYFISTRYRWLYNKMRFLNRLESYWDQLYDSGKYSFEYDYLLVINGTIVHPKLFSYLKKHNPKIVCINYLFDSTQNVYHFDRNFKFFDRIFTFDRKDAEKFSLIFLPIYWKEAATIPEHDSIQLFGFGVFNKTRYEVYSSILDKCKAFSTNSFVKLYVPVIGNTKLFKFKNNIKKIFHLPIDITFEQYNSPLIIHKTLTPKEFRDYIFNSNIILDTSNSKQDGLTARFMWALGAGKKIITNNKSVLEYPFYSREQFFVIDGNYSGLETFIKTPFHPSNDYKAIIEQWRLDNWVNTLLSL